MPSRPTPFDDDAPDHDDIGIEHDSEGSPERGVDRSGNAAQPNYWFRRVVLIGGVVAVLAAAGVIVVNLQVNQTSTDANGSIGADWNRIVLTDTRTGRVIIQNSEGEELARTDTGIRSINSSRVIGPTSLVVGSDEAAIVDLADETTETFEIEAASIEVPSGSALTMIAPSADGSRGVLVHGPSGDRLDTAEFAPIVGTRFEFDQSRSTPSGRSVLVTDSGNFQSVLLSFDREEPSYFPGLALAIDDDLVVTGQNVGTEATISVFDHDGEPIASSRTPSVRAAMLVDDVIQLVTADGEIVAVSTDSGDNESVGQLDIGTITSASVTTNGDVLIVVGAAGTGLVGAEGQTIASFDGLSPVDATWSTRSATCIALTDSATGDLVIAELATGMIRAEAVGGSPITATADGCWIAIPGTPRGVQMVGGAEGATTLDVEGDLVALAPDAAVFVIDLDGRLVLMRDDDETDQTDLGPSGRTLAFTEI